MADLGILGAGIATCMGAGIAVLLMATHFLSRKSTLRLVRGGRTLPTVGKIGVTGFSAFFVDIAMGILTILFNRQIMAWLGTDALAVYGVLVNVSTLVQCCGYSVGQAAQPILSQNFGAGSIPASGSSCAWLSPPRSASASPGPRQSGLLPWPS